MKKIEIDKSISTLFGIGCRSKMPGTLGSGAALIIAIAFHPIHWSAIVAVIVIGTWASHRYSKKIGVNDPSEIVIDEVAGMWISVYGLSLGNMLSAFVLFRVFDILKPFPIHAAEKLPGGIGIMADDAVAGVMVWLIIYTFITFF